MTVPRQEAADALHDVESTEQRSAIAYRYQKFSPHLFLWGVIWIIGYTVSYFRPGASKIWLALVPVGVLSGIWIDKRARRPRGWNYGVNCLAIILYIYAIFAILPPKSDAQAVAFFSPSGCAALCVSRRLDARCAYRLARLCARPVDCRRILLVAPVFSIVDGRCGRRRSDLRRLLAEEGVNR